VETGDESVEYERTFKLPSHPKQTYGGKTSIREEAKPDSPEYNEPDEPYPGAWV